MFMHNFTQLFKKESSMGTAFINAVSFLKTISKSAIAFMVFAFFFMFSNSMQGQGKESKTVVLDVWNFDSNTICGDRFTSTTQAPYSDLASFDDPIEDSSRLITSVDVMFNIAACEGTDAQNDYDYPIELNGTIIGYYNPTELPCQVNVCEPNPMVTYTVDPSLLGYNYNGENTLDLNFLDSRAHICVANIRLTLNTERCELDVDAGDDVVICEGEDVTLTASVTGESQCQDCTIAEESKTIELDVWDFDTETICGDRFTSDRKSVV